MSQIDVAPLERGTSFPAELVNEFVNAVRGKSAVAKLSDQRPLAFNGNEYMVFNMPNEIDVVAENGKKSHGGVTVESKTIVPIKFEYGARVSDEFMYASEEKQMDILRAFSEGFARKVARGLDIASMHGLNPRTGEESQVIADNCFDKQVDATVTYDAETADENLQDAITKVQGKEADVTGIALSPAMGSALGSIKANGIPMYPEFRFGQTPDNFAGLGIDVNGTVAVGEEDNAIVGDFANGFRWGYARQIGVEVIQYGDPDNTGVDLKGSNQVYLRSEIYLGWAILNKDAFARVTTGEASE